jgi:tetratricopeptide (TPR) repeat protein
MGEPMTAAQLEAEGNRNLTRNLEMASGQGSAEVDSMASMTDPQQLMALGSSYKKEGLFKKAAEAYERVCESDKKNPDAPVQLAMCLMHTGDMARADTTFKKALEFYDNVSKPELWHALGQLYALEEKSTNAEDSLNQVLEDANLAADVHFRLSVLACASLNYDKAIDHLKRAAGVVSSEEGAVPSVADIWFELGDVYTLKGGCEPDAQSAFENSGRSRAEHASWHIHGSMLDRLVGFNGKGGALRRKALRAMVRSVEMAQNEAQYWHTLAILHRKMGSNTEAFDCLEHFARLSVARGDKAEAECEALSISLQASEERATDMQDELTRLRAAYGKSPTCWLPNLSLSPVPWSPSHHVILSVCCPC